MNFSASKLPRSAWDHLKKYMMTPFWIGTASICLFFGTMMFVVGLVNMPGPHAEKVTVIGIFLMVFFVIIFCSALARAAVEVKCGATYEVHAPSKDSQGIVRIRKPRLLKADQLENHFFERIINAKANPSDKGYFDVELVLKEAKVDSYEYYKLLLEDVEDAYKFVEKIKGSSWIFGAIHEADKQPLHHHI